MPPTLDATSEPASAASVGLVVVTWGDEPIAIRTFSQGQSLWLGERPGEIPIPLDEGRWRLASYEGPALRLSIPREGSGPSESLLAIGDSAKVVINGFAFTFSHVALAGMPRARGDRGLGWVAGTAVALLSLVGSLAFALPALGLIDAGAIERELSVAALPFLRGASELELGTPAPNLAPEPAYYWVSVPGDMRCGDSEMGSSDVVAEGARYAVSGPKDNPDPHIASRRGRAHGPVHDAEHTGTKGGPDPKAPVAPWGRDTALGQDEDSASGAIWGDPIADARGADGLGLALIEGGLAKRIQWTAAGSGGASARVVHSGLSVRGPLRPSAVTPVVAKRFGAFRGCYERALEANPVLRGRIDVAFEVGGDGQVRALRIARSELVEPELESCLLGSFQGLSFLETASVASALVYPLFFIPGDGGETSARGYRREHAPACCTAR